MSIQIDVKNALVARILLVENGNLGYELMFSGFKSDTDITQFSQIFSLTSPSNQITTILPLIKARSEKLGLEYRETVITRRKNIAYFLLKWATRLYHRQYKTLGEFKYRLVHKIERFYE